MVNRASKSRKSGSGSATSATRKDSNKKSVLAVKSTENMRKSKLQNASNGTGGKLTVKEPKTKHRSVQKKTTKVDADKPKKPPTAFFYYLEDFRKEYQEQNPNIKSMRDIGKACGEKWKTMTYEEKVKYYDIAMEKRAEFDRAMAEYLKRKELEFYHNLEDDSDD